MAQRTLHRDVVIIGGGSSGTQLAIRLQQAGVTVAVVERQNRLGGHTSTFVAKDGETFDYATQVLVNTTEVRTFFEYLKAPLAPLSSGGKSVTVDINRSVTGPAFPVANANESAAALERYEVQMAKYPDIFLGYHLPDPVPDDLLLSWGEFLRKYDLEALAYDGFLQFQGMGNILDQPTLYMMKLFNPMQVKAREDNLKVHEAKGDVQALWDSARRVLGDSVPLNAEITQTSRCSSGVEVVCSTPEGQVDIHASKIIVTVPPKLQQLSFLDLTPDETALFSQWNNSYYYNAVLDKTGLPSNTSVYNYGLDAYGGIPRLPGVYFFAASGISDLYSLQYSSPSYMTNDEVKADIRKSVASCRKALNITEGRLTEIVAYNNHSPFGLTVSTTAIKSGFYERLTALHGQDSTFWTGNTWSSGSSSTIWDFNVHELLPAIMASLGKH